MKSEVGRIGENIKGLFDTLLEKYQVSGDIGFASFHTVYDYLHPAQKRKLRMIVDDRLQILLAEGSFVCIGVAYQDPIIDYIDVKTGTKTDYCLWNRYAEAYHRINQILNEMVAIIAKQFKGIPLLATIEGIAGTINHVRDYFKMIISHRAIAECAGLGWRGKNQLIIHEKRALL